MNANEIRNMPFQYNAAMQVGDNFYLDILILVREAVAQIAEINEHMQGQQISVRINEDVEPSYTDEDIARQVVERNAALAEPVSNPLKFVRCMDCFKEMPIGSLKPGLTGICDDCMPF